MYNEGIRTFTANGALAAKVRVKLTAASATVPSQVEVAGLGEQHIGTTEFAVADGAIVAVRLRTYPGTHEGKAAKAIAVGATLYAAANGFISDASNGTAIGIAIEQATALNDIIEFIDFTVISTTAATISIADAGNFTAQATVEAALQELYQHTKSIQAILPIPINAWTQKTGAALAVFADGASDVPGWSATDKTAGIRWNNHATPLAVKTSVPVPMDMDVTANAVLHILAAKVGATVGDAVTFTVEAFNNVVAALYDADADYGGASSAMTGDAATKTIQEVTLTLALANLPAAQATLVLTMAPTAGLLGTDDVIVLGTWIEYKRKILTS